MSLKSLVQTLAAFAKNNEERAFNILGARPGPGIDLLIKPVEPLCGKWFVTGLTPCGSAFIDKFWMFQPLGNQRVAEMRKQATEWGLSFRTEYTTVSIDSTDIAKPLED
jgi:hypothetical protein